VTVKVALWNKPLEINTQMINNKLLKTKFLFQKLRLQTKIDKVAILIENHRGLKSKFSLSEI